jgi:hypothetical protein
VSGALSIGAPAARSLRSAIVRRLLIPLALTVLVAVGLSACDVSVTPGAARIGSETISKATLTDAVKAVASDKGLVCTISAADSSASISIEGAGAGTYDAGFTASQLSEMISQRISSDLVAKLGVAVTSGATAIGRSRLDAKLDPQSGSTCTEGGAATVNDLASSYRSVLISAETNLDLISAHFAGVPLSTAGLAAYATAHESVAYNDCVSAILTETKSAAALARAAIESGQSFGSVAKADSKDTSSAPDGGVLGCLPNANFDSPLNTELATLPIGQVSQPVEFTSESTSGSTTTGYVLLLVTARQAPTTLEALNALDIAEETAANSALAKADAAANVSVDPEFGTWKDVDGDYQVVPPTGPASGYLADPTAITPPTVPLG